MKDRKQSERRARDIWRRTERHEYVEESEITSDVLEFLNEWCEPDLEVASSHELGEY